MLRRFDMHVHHIVPELLGMCSIRRYYGNLIVNKDMLNVDPDTADENKLIVLNHDIICLLMDLSIRPQK